VTASPNAPTTDAPRLRVFNHFTGEKEEFRPLDPRRATMYVCGMTVQGPPHLGHMLAFVAADLVRRTLEFFGYDVLHVQNFTDIDDKIIARAAEQGLTAGELAQRNIDKFFEAADLLNILRAHEYPRVTGHIEEIIAYIERLIAKGHAYAAGGSVWFDVRSYAPYGKLSRRNVDDLRTAVRVELDESKHDPLDFALWKGAKEGEPAWPSPWGPGRPGWHIECSVMSTKYLGETFDFHGGGRDLIFPHHENELAQSCALGGDFVRYWMHNGLLTLDGQKMAKSTGHFFSVDEVLGEFDRDVVRYYLLRGHFRNQMEFGRERLQEAAAAYDRMKRALLQLATLAADPGLGAEIATGITSPAGVQMEEAAERARRGFVDGLADDFNAEAGMASLFELVRTVNPMIVGAPAGIDADPLRQVLAVLRACLGVLGLFERVRPEADEVPPEIQEMLRRRQTARKERDFATADSLRDEILALGWVIEDGAAGARVRRI
jgi:cysteinyl-tRNA synthetase